MPVGIQLLVLAPVTPDTCVACKEAWGSAVLQDAASICLPQEPLAYSLNWGLWGGLSSACDASSFPGVE